LALRFLIAFHRRKPLNPEGSIAMNDMKNDSEVQDRTQLGEVNYSEYDGNIEYSGFNTKVNYRGFGKPGYSVRPGDPYSHQDLDDIYSTTSHGGGFRLSY
jgi:hypothetical protein